MSNITLLHFRIYTWTFLCLFVFFLSFCVCGAGSSPWSCQDPRAVSRSAVCSARRERPWCCPSHLQPYPDLSSLSPRGSAHFHSAWWLWGCLRNRRSQNTSGSRGKRSGTCGGKIKQVKIWPHRDTVPWVLLKSPCPDRSVPGQSLATKFLEVQATKGIDNNFPLGIRPLNHGCSLVFVSLSLTQRNTQRNKAELFLMFTCGSI